METNMPSLLKNFISTFVTLVLSMTILLILENILENQIHRGSHEEHPKPRASWLGDDSKLLNLKNFKYLLNNPTKCGREEEILAIIIVTSYEAHIETRSAMRRAIPEQELERLRIKRVFLLAVAPETDKYAISQDALINEQKRYGDLIQGNFIEAYRNLTYKHIMGLSWAGKYCSHAKYVIKMDDDIVIDFYKIVQMLNKFQYNRLFFAGYVFHGMQPKRDPANKWYVTYYEYSKPMYPVFVSGWFYVTTPYVAQQLVNTGRFVPYFWIDDVYVTGILMKVLKWKHSDIHEIFTANSAFLECCIRDFKQYQYDCDVAVGPNGGDAELFVKFNEALSKCRFHNSSESIPCHSRPLGKELTKTCVAEFKGFPLGNGDAKIEDYKLF
ncbi:beta-1,3-galactosyltransferase 5 [Chrysoperla carnea]|uniref:beta-1,3-galactosyltransferase 5 n=1 Tax=Chrysoperla carnea TaxID=189513 RepID=UPI001D081773|nr:beta-1,3-galactosyltransferase 5 [Chrysoperla carnea]